MYLIITDMKLVSKLKKSIFNRTSDNSGSNKRATNANNVQMR